MLDNYDEIAFKSITYPVIVALQKAIDELSVVQVKEDCEENCMFLINWIEELDWIVRAAHESIESYTKPLGYHPEIEIPENF